MGKNMNLDDGTKLPSKALNANEAAPVSPVPPSLDLRDAAAASKFASDLPVAPVPPAKLPLPTPVYTMRETAEILKTSEKTVYRLLVFGKLKRLPALRHVRVTRLSLEQLLASSK